MPRTFRIALYADDDEKRTKGLMFTNPLPEDQCALFVFPRRADHSFWNKNVSYPLTLAFCDGANRVAAVRDMDAGSEAPCRAGDPDIKYVVEVTKGALEGVSPGDSFLIDPLGGAVKFGKR
jgi:uncharacterized membrane protein (UPF0127 family)